MRRIAWTVDFLNPPGYWEAKNDSFQEALIYLSRNGFDVSIITLHRNRTDSINIKGINYQFCKNENEIVKRLQNIQPEIINLWGFDRPVNKMINQTFPDTAKTVYIVGHGQLKETNDLPHVKRVFVSDNEQRKELCSSTLYPQSQIIVAPWTATNVFNFKDYTKPERYDIIFVSNWLPLKRQHLLIEALPMINFERVCFLGDVVDEDYYKKWREATRKQYGLGYIEMINRVPGSAVASYYHESKVAVQLSESEGGSRVVAEVLSSGVPLIVCKDCQSNCSSIEHGVNGFIIEPTKEALAKQITELLENRSYREKIGKNALKQMEECKTRNSMSIIFNREFKRILAEKDIV